MFQLSVVLLCTFLTGGIQAKHSQNRIVGGGVANFQDHPYMASLRVDGNHFCAGTILNTKYILTAAHCFNNLPSYTIKVHVGTSTLLSQGTVFDVSLIKKHPNYNQNSDDNDIALVQLSTYLTYGPNIQATSLYRYNLPSISTATLVGWGSLIAGGGLSVNLRRVEVNTVNSIECTKTYKKMSTNNQMCTQLSGKGACIGDDGGPVLVNNKQVGIIIRTANCDTNTPNLHTRISAYSSWIDTNSFN